jgi:hypothetical protein
MSTWEYPRVPLSTLQSWAAPADAKQSARAVREFMSEVHAWVMLRLTTQLDTSRSDQRGCTH